MTITTALTLTSMAMLLWVEAPLALGIWLLIMTITTAMSMNFLLNMWMMLTLILIYVGGLLVMFSYFTVINPNMKIQMLKMSHFMLMTFMLITITMKTMKSLHIMSLTNNLSMKPLITDFLLTSHIYPLLIITIVLLTTLIAAVKIPLRRSGTMRPFN